MSATETIGRSAPLWLWAAAALGAAWNIFGLVQLADFVWRTRSSLMMQGMSADAAELYYGLPAWMSVAFAVGSVGGLLGSIALAARREEAVLVFVISLVGYVALFTGDYAYGVFDAMPGQLGVLLVVLAVAVMLLVAGLHARSRQLLR